jgi:two-component system, cell cycle response regulator
VPVAGGWAYAVRPVDPAFLARLSTAAGTPVSLGGQAPGTSADPLPLRFGPAPGGNVPAPPDRRLALVLATALTAVTTAAALAAWLSALVTRPLRQLLVTVDRAASGDLTVRSQLTGRDEVGRIGTRLDGLVGGAREVQRLAVTDELTGLGNVRHLADSLRLEVERAARFRRTLGVLLLDLDHFKEVNDAHGHRAGDAVLTEFADRIKGVVREVDLAFRQGGEEFVILLPETDIAGSLTAARRIGEAVRAEPFTVGAVQIAVTVSIGVAVYPRHAGSGAETLEAADAALYAAKAAGRDTFSVAGGVLPVQRESRYVLPVATGPAGGASVGTPRTQIPADG